MIPRDHHGGDACRAGGSDRLDRLGARRVCDADQAEARRSNLGCSRRDRHREDAQTTFGHLRVGLRDVVSALHAQRQDALDRALDVHPTVGPLDGHPLGHRVERGHRDARVRAFDLGTVNPALGGGEQDGHFRGIADAIATVGANLGVAARGGGGEQCAVVTSPELAHTHDARGQRAGLVRTDHGRAAKRLNRWQPSHEHIPRGHALHADRERDRDDCGQPLRHRSDGQRDGRHEHLHERPAA